MTIEELIKSMETGGFLVYCPGTKKNITIQQYIEMYEKHLESDEDKTE